MNDKFGEEFPRIGAPAFRALDAFGIQNLSDLTQYSEEELLALHGFGPRALGLIKEKLESEGLALTTK